MRQFGIRFLLFLILSGIIVGDLQPFFEINGSDGIELTAEKEAKDDFKKDEAEKDKNFHSLFSLSFFYSEQNPKPQIFHLDKRRTSVCLVVFSPPPERAA